MSETGPLTKKETELILQDAKKNDPYEMATVPRTTYRHLAFMADRLAALESAVIVREDLEAMGYEAPGVGVLWWYRYRNGRCEWVEYDDCDPTNPPQRGPAPDLRPDLEGPVTLPVVNLRGE